MKKINLQDMPYSYEYDEITCFEHPVIVTFDFLNNGMGFCYALLSKLRGIYIPKQQQNYNVREYVLKEVSRHFGVSIEEPKSLSYKKIMDYLDNDIPVIIGVNLKNIFYSNYYAEHDWVHWFLIKGYKRKGELVTLLDNTQFEHIGHAYENFNIPFDIVKQANKSYVKKYGNEYASLIFGKEKQVDFDSMMMYILKAYTDIDLTNQEVYRQNALIKLYADTKIRNNSFSGAMEMLGEDILNEFRKKLININKYREVLFNGISEYMQKSEFNMQMINEFAAFNLHVGELKNLWQKIIMKAIVKTMHGEKAEELVNEEVVHKEKLVQDDVRKFVKYLTEKSPKEKVVFVNGNKEEKGKINERMNERTCGLECCDVRFENNDNQIISNIGHESYGKTTFTFNGISECNWWDMDNAPKLIFENEVQQGMELVAELCISEYEGGNFETGIFVREKGTGRSYLEGIENERHLVISEIGKEGYKFDIDKKNKYSLFIREAEGNIEFGFKKNGEEWDIMFATDDMDLKHCELGIVCKTWSKNIKLKVEVEWHWTHK